MIRLTPVALYCTLQLGGTDIRRNTKENPEKIYNHVDLCHMLDIRDTEPNGGAAEGTKVAGGRAYFLKGHGCMLNQALINYGLVYLAKRGYTQMHCPFFMRQSMMGQCAQLSQFDEELYKVATRRSPAVPTTPYPGMPLTDSLCF